MKSFLWISYGVILAIIELLMLSPILNASGPGIIVILFMFLFNVVGLIALYGFVSNKPFWKPAGWRLLFWISAIWVGVKLILLIISPSVTSVINALYVIPLLYVLFKYSAVTNPVWNTIRFDCIATFLTKYFTKKEKLKTTVVSQTPSGKLITSVAIEKIENEFLVNIQKDINTEEQSFIDRFDNVVDAANFLVSNTTVRASDFAYLFGSQRINSLIKSVAIVLVIFLLWLFLSYMYAYTENENFRKMRLKSLLDCNTMLYHCAIENNEIDVFAQLVEDGVDIEFKDGWGRSALFWVVSGSEKSTIDRPGRRMDEHKRARAIDALLINGADPNTKQYNDQTVLHLTVYKKDYDVIKKLLKAGADINAASGKESSDWEMPLHLSVARNDINTTRLLLDESADPNAVNSYHMTALFKSAFNKNIEITKLLLQYGADKNIESNRAGYTALEYIRLYPDYSKEIEKMLTN